MSMRDYQSYYSHYRPDQELHDIVRPQTPDVGPEDTLKPLRSRDSQATDDCQPASPNSTTPPELVDKANDEGSGNRSDQSNGPTHWLNALPLLEAFISWVEGPPTGSSPKRHEKEKPNPLLDIPFQFIALLTYPEPDPRLGNKMTLAMVRETSFVKQRRKTLLMLTCYTLVVRYCSFDFFLVVLFASNCALLFLMKNSGKMNVNMAKRAVGQRVGWAKQWAGGFFRRSAGLAPVAGAGTGPGAGAGPGQSENALETSTQLPSSATYSNTFSSPNKSMVNISTMVAESVRNVPVSTGGEKTDSAHEGNSPQVKRRGLFGKKKTLTINASGTQGVPAAAALAPSNEGTGDEVSILTNRTPRRMFFKRVSSSSNTNTNTNSSSGTGANGNASATSSKVALSSSAAPAQYPPPSILTPRPSVTLASSPLIQSQSQALPHLSILPPRSPSPSAVRKDNPFFRGWSATPPPTQPQHQHQHHQHHQHQHEHQHPLQHQDPISPHASSSSSAASSPKATTTAPPVPPAGRSLTSINPISFLASLSHSQKQQQQLPSQPSQPSQPSSSLSPPLKAPSSAFSAITAPLSPQPKHAAVSRSALLSQSLTGTYTDILVYEAETIERSLESASLPHSSVDPCSSELWLCNGNGPRLVDPRSQQELQEYHSLLFKTGHADETARLSYSAAKEDLIMDHVAVRAAEAMETFGREA
ncbi:hypothetical protein BGZ70_009389 [Mortierella alpina]|uniref:Uncharacterized protein n=1 Tax=Mortierella alpina TaxID=64518 RepID=A0A9P6JD35_MORAP|nr:hypothetical protein BGZ70_009389 [Mortierella alpina]